MELGTVIRARCTASSDSPPPPPVVMWFKDGVALLNEPPHIRIRSNTNGSEVTSVLTIDNFQSSDDGEYYCEATNTSNTLSSTILSLTG